MKNSMKKIWFNNFQKNIFYLFFLFFLLYYFFEEFENMEESLKNRTIENDGFRILYDPNYSIETVKKPSFKLKNDVLSILPKDYIFIDYVYQIKNIALSTFHRDVTSSHYLYKTKYPIYTLILYKYDGYLLSVCPKSNQTYPFVWSRIVNLKGKSGTAVLFDSELLHAGYHNNCKKRELIQYKICHKDDLHLLKHLIGIDVIKNEKCHQSVFTSFMKKMSYYFEMPINYFLYPIMTKRHKNNTITGKIQYFIPISYYNNT
jgi:hypothetical protein